ncbi:hypothetical protein MKX01_041907, partial [Papaver californicum]
SATVKDSLVGVFCFKPFDAELDWSLVVKASPCYMTYLKDSIDQIINFFDSSSAVSQTIAMETAAAVQMTIDEVKRTAQQQVTKALEDRTRFFLDLDIAAPKIIIPTNFFPDDSHATKLLLDLGNLKLSTQDDGESDSPDEMDMYLQFNLGLSDVSAVLVDGDYHWSQTLVDTSASFSQSNYTSFLPVIDKCGIVMKLQQIRTENISYPSTRLAVRLPSLGFHFSPARYHRLMEIVKIFQSEDSENSDNLRPWIQADFEGWLSVLAWKGVGNREAVWQRRYCCLVGSFLYVLESPLSKTYKQFIRLRGKQIYEDPSEFAGNVEHVLAISDASQSNSKVVEHANALILRCESDESSKIWHSRLQGAIYRASGSAPITANLSNTSSDSEDAEVNGDGNVMDILEKESLFITGVLDELKICFDYNKQSGHAFKTVLLAEESRLFEFRALGGQVEISLRGKDMFVGTVLKTLEIEDLVYYEGATYPRYLARSFIKRADALSADASEEYYDVPRSYSNNELTQYEGEESFFEASESLGDVIDSPAHTRGNKSPKPLLKPPSFCRVSGLLPDYERQEETSDSITEALDSFVKAQIVIYDLNSSLYNNIDKRVEVTLATLSLFCYRPTVLAILDFVAAVNISGDSSDACNEKSADLPQESSREDMVDDQNLSSVQESVMKGLLGKGKSRVIFYLTLNMARAEILLMNENGTRLATLSQNNLLTDIKVFPSSFSIKAALGNLKISDDSLPSNHSYFWVCDMRNPGGSSFVELLFTSFSVVDEDYKGYEYSLFGQLSEVRIVYLNRFIQEIISYFMGLVPNNSKDVAKVKDRVTNSEKWFTTSEIEGSPAFKLDLSLRKPIIVMPQRTDSHDYLELDVVHITVQNTFQWLRGDKNEMGAVHLEILTVQVKDINLTVGTEAGLGESIIQDVKGVSVTIRRSLRDLLHQIPATEAAIKIDVLIAALSNREYQIITQCASSNFSETPNSIPPLKQSETSSHNIVQPVAPPVSAVEFEVGNGEKWITMTVSVAINLVELSLHSGETRDAPLASLQISDAWLFYKSNTAGEGFLSATLKGFIVIDDREGSKEEFRLAIGKPESLRYGPLLPTSYDDDKKIAGFDKSVLNDSNAKSVLTMLIVDVKFNQSSTSISLCIQRPQLLVALDFLLAVVEFFVPTVSSALSNKDDDIPLHIADAIILDQPIYYQPSAEISLSPQKPLIADDERFDHFIYDGKGGNLYVQDRWGENLHSLSSEAVIYVGSGKKLQFRNVCIKNGQFFDSSILLGANSSYSVSEDDQAFLDLEKGDEGSLNASEEHIDHVPTKNAEPDRPTEFIIELQAVGPELTFYNTSKDVEESSKMCNKLLHAQLDAFCRVVMKGDTLEMTANALGLTMESSGVRILEPFDTSIKFSNASGRTNIHVAVTDIFMNFSFSTLRLFLAVEEDIMAFMRMSSKKATLVCSEFDKVGMIQNPHDGQTYAFWRPRAPPGFAVLGDYLTPLDKPPTKGVLAVNANFVRVKRPLSFKLIWPPPDAGALSYCQGAINNIRSSEVVPNIDDRREEDSCSIWIPVAPPGYVSMGCVVSSGRLEPPSSSALCILASLVSPCAFRDCISISFSEQYPSRLAFWRVDNSVGTFLPANVVNLNVIGRAYELRHVIFSYLEDSSQASMGSSIHEIPLDRDQTVQSERSAISNSGRRFEAIASFKLIWWNQGSSSRKKLSIWRPLVSPGMIFLGDIAVQGYEPPNTCVVLHDTGDEALFRNPVDFQAVGQIKKQRGAESISFWLPLAPPGYVSLGCVACKGSPKQDDMSLFRCIRSDMVTGGQFLEESIWDSSDTKVTTGPFSIWTVGDELGTFLVRSGFRKPPKRFALRLADVAVASGSDDTVVDAEMRTFSLAVFDDYGGLMVPLFNISLSGVGFSLHGRSENLNSTMSFSLEARSYNDKYDSWEPLIEPVDGFLRYQYDLNSPGAASQLRLTSPRDLNLNFSVSNCNMILQAYASWNNLSHVHESYKKRDSVLNSFDGKSIIGFHHRAHYYIVPQNKLGQDIFIRATEKRGLQNIIKMPSGDVKPVKVPVSKNMLDSHLKGKLDQRFRTMVTVIIVDGQFPTVEGLSAHQYTVAIRLVPNECLPSDSLLKGQSARTSGTISDRSLPSGFQLVQWNEAFFFKIDSPDFYMMELMVTDMGQGEPVGFYSAPLKQIGSICSESSKSYGPSNELNWMELSSARSMSMPREDEHNQSHGRLRCAILLLLMSEENVSETSSNDKRRGLLQISPAKEGPWTSVKLNYAAPAACWRLGNDVVASEVSVKDGNRFVNIRSLVSVTNNSEFMLDVCLTVKGSYGNMKSVDDNKQGVKDIVRERFDTDDFFETQKFNPDIGWVGCLTKSLHSNSEGEDSHQEISEVDLPSGWEWTDDWHIDNASVNTAEGWVYAPDLERLEWPESYNQLKFVNYARQRRWVRNRKRVLGGVKQQIPVGLLNPGDTVPLPLLGLTHPGVTYILQLRPWSANEHNNYTWSSLVGVPRDQPENKEMYEIAVSSLSESEELLYCTSSETCESSSSRENSRGLWFCLSIKATEIGKDNHSDPIQDWNLVIKAPLSIVNFLPLAAEFSVLEMQDNGKFFGCSRGILSAGETIGIYKADLRKPLYLSLLPQGGWSPVHDAVMVSHPSGVPSKTIGLKSSFTGRIVQVILEQNHDQEQLMVAKIVRIYAPFWIASARCPPLTYQLVATAGKKKRNFSLTLSSKQSTEMIVEEITEQEIFEGYTIDSTLNFKSMGLSVSISQSSKKHFGPVTDLSSLGDMDGTVDLYAYDEEGSCIHLFISSKPCPYQSVPTKVISVRPFMTFTNRIGQDIFVKLSSEDDPKVLRASDSRVSFVYRKTEGSDRLQVRLESTEWSFPVEITKEDTIFIVLRTSTGSRRFLRAEIRGYEEGSRFVVVFRLGSTYGPIRVENRTVDKIIRIRQCGLSDNSWIQLSALSTTNFCWEDPYGERLIDAEIQSEDSVVVQKLSLDRAGEVSSDVGTPEVQFHVVDLGHIMIARFTDHRTSESISQEGSTALATTGNWGTSEMKHRHNTSAPMEIMIELGVVGVSIIDHRPRELSYLYLERVFISYSTGYDGGNTSRVKLILGHMQIDNQLPLTLIPVLLGPEHTADAHHPVFKTTITMRNDNNDGTLVYPYVYIRVTEKTWRLSIHEPIIWAFVDFYNNLQMDRIPRSSSVTQVDPEIRVDLIDVSEVRLKIKLETAPAQRPHGVLGVWSPILSAVGNAFKIQVHLRKVMHRNRFMRQSSVVPAIVNRIWRDLIHNPLHLIFSVDVLGMTSSTLASLSKGFAELSTDGQFLQLRMKQVWSRRITGVGDGILQGTEALAQGFAFGVSGVVTKPVESARQNGLLGFAHGVGQAFLGFIVQPVSGALDFFSLTVDGIGASCTRCLEVFNNKTAFQRIRNPRTIHADGVLREYSEREATGQMILYLAEASRHFGCTEIFKEPSKYAWSDYYEEHFIVPYQRIVLVTNKRVMLLQCMAPDKMDKKPSKIMWDIPWGDLMSLELAKAGYSKPSHLILHLKNFKRSEKFVRLIKCSVEETDEEEPQAARICSVIHKVWKRYQADMRCVTLKVPSSQRHVYFSWEEADGRDSQNQMKPIIKPREYFAGTTGGNSGDKRFIKHTINFQKIWSSESESKGRSALMSRKQVLETGGVCSIWRPTCPDGYVSVGDVAHVGSHPPNVSATYHNVDEQYALPVGYDLVWRNCIDDYATPVTIWFPRAPDGYVSLGCVAVAGFMEPQNNIAYCVKANLAEETLFEEQKVWTAKESYPWACHIYQVQSDALNFVALRQPKEESEWKPMRVIDVHQPLQTSELH